MKKVTKEPKRRPGRPSKKTPEVCAEICERLARGEPLAQICRDEHMPDPSTVWDWSEADDEVSQAIARARKVGFDVLAAQCLEIADTTQEGVRTEISKDGDVKEVREDMLGHRKLQIETRLKLLAKWDPKRYGERTTLAGDPESPLSLLLNDISTNPKSRLTVP